MSIVEGEDTTTFVYDGDGKRGKKTENDETILYVNKYYEKKQNLTTSVVTLHYYLGDKLIATKEGDTLRYVHQDSLTSTTVMSDTNGDSAGSITYFPYGATRSGSVPTDKKFTGQRIDGTGLYYYNARYYDPTIGRFISADTIVPDYTNPQSLNRYTYVLDNPLRYTDPTGNFDLEEIVAGAQQTIVTMHEGLQVAVSETMEIYQAASQAYDMAIVAGMHTAGIISVEYYTDTNLMGGSVPVYHFGDKGIVPILIGDISGISLYPIGAFVKESYYLKDSSISVHESYHYYEQSNWEIIPWLTVYYGEMALDWIYYGGDYWTGPYNNNSREIAARDYAGQPIYPYTTQTPWWQDLIDSIIESDGGSYSYGENYYDYY